MYNILRRNYKHLLMFSGGMLVMLVLFVLIAPAPSPSPPPTPTGEAAVTTTPTVPQVPEPPPAQLSSMVLRQSDVPPGLILRESRPREPRDYSDGEPLEERGWKGGYMVIFGVPSPITTSPELVNINSEYSAQGAKNALDETVAGLLQQGYVMSDGATIGDEVYYLQLDLEVPIDAEGNTQRFTTAVVVFRKDNIYEYVGFRGPGGAVSLEQTTHYAQIVESRVEEYY